MAVRIQQIKRGQEIRTLYLPEGWDDSIRDMGDPSDSFGMTYEYQVADFWLDENGNEWQEVPYTPYTGSTISEPQRKQMKTVQVPEALVARAISVLIKLRNLHDEDCDTLCEDSVEANAVTELLEQARLNHFRSARAQSELEPEPDKDNNEW